MTGNFEVTVFPGSKTQSGEGKIVHSKKATGKFPSIDYPSFMAALEEALK